MPLDSYDYLAGRQKLNAIPQSQRALPNYDALLAAQVKRDIEDRVNAESSRIKLENAQNEIDTNRSNLNSSISQNRLATAISIGNIGAEGYRSYQNVQMEKEKDRRAQESDWKYKVIWNAIMNNTEQLTDILHQNAISYFAKNPDTDPNYDITQAINFTNGDE